MRHNKNATNLNFLEVVRQHILGVMDNVVRCFVGNLTGSSERILKIG